MLEKPSNKLKLNFSVVVVVVAITKKVETFEVRLGRVERDYIIQNTA